MVWSYYTRTYSDCRPIILLSVLLHLKHFKAVYSAKPKAKANLNRKHWLNYWHRCKHRCRGRLMHGIDALALNFNLSKVSAHIVIACDGPNIRLCAKSDNTAMTTVLMVI